MEAGAEGVLAVLGVDDGGTLAGSKSVLAMPHAALKCHPEAVVRWKAALVLDEPSQNATSR